MPGQLTEWDSQQRTGEPAPKQEQEGSVSWKISSGCGDKQCKVRCKCSMLLEKNVFSLGWVLQRNSGTSKPRMKQLSIKKKSHLYAALMKLNWEYWVYFWHPCYQKSLEKVSKDVKEWAPNQLDNQGMILWRKSGSSNCLAHQKDDWGMIW